MMLSAAAWTRLDDLLEAASQVPPARRSDWLDARHLRPELRAYLDARLALGDEAPGETEMASAPRRPVSSRAPVKRESRVSDRVAPTRASGAGRAWGIALAGTAALLAWGAAVAVRPRAELAR